MKAATRPPFDPNFEGLLREAAAAPHSMLLRVKRPEIFPALRTREAAVSVAMAGLSSVERELLASYRSELGLLLRQAAVSVFLSDQTARQWIDDTFGEQPHEILDPQVWARKARETLEIAPTGTTEPPTFGVEYLHGLISGGLASASLPAIAAASLRVEAVDQPRIYTGAYMAANGQSAASLAVLSTILDGVSNPDHESSAREDMALALGRMGRYTEAADVIHKGIFLGTFRAELPLRYLFYSVLEGNSERVEQAACIVDENVAVDHPALVRECTGIRRKLRIGKWKMPTQTTRQFELQLGQFKRASRMLINAVLTIE